MYMFLCIFVQSAELQFFKIMLAKTPEIFCIALLSCALVSCASVDVCGRRIDSLEHSSWEHSEWISVVDAPVVRGRVISSKNNRAADGASCFLSELSPKSKVLSAKWMTAGLGVYELYVNGHLIGAEILKPGFTDNSKTKYSFTYDITDVFNCNKGQKNTLFAQVTPGWWGDKIVTPHGYDGMLGRKCAFRGVLELTFEDGTKQLFGTDSLNWKAGLAGPVKHAAIFDGEIYDARELPGYLSSENFSTPEINREFAGEILPSDGAEVYLLDELSLNPESVYVWDSVKDAKDGEYGKVAIKRTYKPGRKITLEPGERLVVDFGQNAACVPSFVFKAEEGTVLTCLPGEILNDGNGSERRGMDGPEGSVHRRNLRIPDSGMSVEYTFGSKKGWSSYIPTRTFFGYRYLAIEVTAKTVIKRIESVPVSSATSELQTGFITTGNELVNKIISNTLWSLRSNYLSIPSDCPQRNERLGWTADTHVFAETGSFFSNTLRFMHKWMRDMRDSQTETGAFLSVVPKAQIGFNSMRFGWADAGVIVPWTMWKQFGDTTIIRENWEAMEKFVDHVAATRYRHELLLDENQNMQYADWLSYEPLESYSKSVWTPGVKPRVLLPEALDYWNYLAACYWAIDAGMMRDMAAVIGADVAEYENMLYEAKSYIKESFFTNDGRFKNEMLNTMQTPALFALKIGVVEGSAKEVMIERLRANFTERRNRLSTGFLGTSILMPTLTQNGMTDIAYELLLQRENPSWIYSIDNGATTIWERWNSYTKEAGMGPDGMNSFNHYAYGCVCEWIWETVAGISCDVSDPGFRTIVMKPVPDKRLGYVNAEYQSAAGMIKSSWKYKGNLWIWNFTVPSGAKALVTLPGENETKVFGPGQYKIVR